MAAGLAPGWKAEKGRWRAALYHGGRTHFLGYFNDEEDAARAYDAKLVELGGGTLGRTGPLKLPSRPAFRRRK